jgi:hypothetical protein
MPAKHPNRKAACVLALLTLAVYKPALRAQNDAVPQADRNWTAAVQKGDATASGALLDSQFEWIDAKGQLRSRAETLGSLATLAGVVQGETNVQSYSYNRMQVFTGERQNVRFMRIWVQRSEGWRLFQMIETVRLASAPTPFAPPTGGPVLDCDNPCRTIPFNPQTSAQRQMLDIFKQLKVDEWKPNPDNWAPYVLDDVYYVTGAASMSKADRVARLAEQRRTGAVALPGDPVVSMRIAEFGQSAVMFARHNPFRGGKPYYSVRVWTHRDGRWQLANTQQTVIDSAANVASMIPR